MPWRPLPNIAFAICTYPFQPSSTADLPLQIGDELYIIEEAENHGSWLRGYLVAPPSLLAGLTSNKDQSLEARVFAGIFPRVCVEIREVFDEKDASPAKRKLDGAPVQASGSSHISGGWPTPSLGQTSQTHPSEAEQARNSRNAHPARDLAFPVPPSIRQPTPEDGSQLSKPTAPVPMLKIGDETGASKREPLIDEIASCLREWHSTNLHKLLLNRQYERLEEISQIVTRLDTARRQLHHRILTDQELNSVRDMAIWDLVQGNRILSGEVIVRSLENRGRMLTAEDSALKTSSLQSMMSLLDERPETGSDPKVLHHTLVRLKEFVNKSGSQMTLSIALCAKDESGNVRNVSEMFMIRVSEEGATAEHQHSDWSTLFTDLSSADIKGVQGQKTQLILVVKAFTDEPVREHNPRLQRTPTTSDGTLSANPKHLNSGLRTNSLRSGRRSVMFGFGARKDTYPTADGRPKTGDSLRAKTPDLRDEKKSQTQMVKRLTGVAALDITSFLQAEGDAERELTLWSVPSPDSNGSRSNSQQQLVDSPEQSLAGALLGPSNRMQGAQDIAKLKIGFNSFVHPDSNELIQLRPTLLQNILTTRKIGFAEAPEHARSDIYVTLIDPLLPTHGSLSHPRQGSVSLPPESELNNLQITLEVRNASGERIKDCIHPFSNSSGHTAWRTVATDLGEKWNQTVKLAVEPDDVPGSHIVMSIANASVNFPFALCWMPLWTQEAFLRDGEHSLTLHKYDEETSDMIAGKRAYLGLPWTSKAKDETVTGPLATVRLQTYLCSTAYSQDPTLLGILKWRDQRSKDLTTLLHRFSFVPQLEVVKLLSDVLDALFEILVQHTDNDEIEDLTFSALVDTLKIVYDRRFNLQPRVEEYAHHRFNFPFAFPCLTRSFRRLLQDPTNPINARRLPETCKVGSSIFMFFIQAREQQIEKEVGIGIRSHAPTIAKDLEPLFQDMQRVMLSPKPALIGTKTLMVQNFYKWLPELANALTSTDILQIAMQFAESSSGSQGRLILYRLLMLQKITASRLFAAPRDDKVWNDSVTRWMSPYWKCDAAISQQWREQVRLCCSVVFAQRTAYGFTAPEWMTELTRAYVILQKEPATRPSPSRFSLLFPDTYPFPMKPVTDGVALDESLVELSAILAEMSHDAANYPTLPDEDLALLIIDIIRVMTSILDCQAFPSSWLTLYMYHHKATLRTMQTIFTVLTDRFLPSPDNPDEFSTEAWNAYFSLLLKVVASEALSLEVFQEQKRKAVWKIAGDVRELGADLLQRSWGVIAWESSEEQKRNYGLERMGGFQVQYVPSLVGQVTELCLSVQQELRRAGVTLLKSMIINEWDLSQDLRVIENEMVNCLDRMFKRKSLNDAMVQKAFIGDLFGEFEPFDDGHHHDLVAAVKGLIEVVDELLDLLVAVHSAETNGEAVQTVDTIRLMEFLRDMKRESIYVGYVHRLAEIQEKAGNLTEAGLALQMHADLYDWDSSRQLEESSEPSLPSQTSFERKEYLYFETIKHFEEGAAWQQALNAYNELTKVYGTDAFDFAKLARTQRAMAAIYERLQRGELQPPHYFRVLFRGMGFSSSLRGKEFIFQGSSTDRTSSFGDKLLQQYPGARVISGHLEDEIEGQYLSIYAVGPQRDFMHPVNRRPNISQAIRDYFTLASPRHFTMSSRRQASAGAIEDQMQTKTAYTTAEAFPNILRRSEIINTEMVQLLPVQIGLERTTRKTQDLLNLQKQAESGSEASMISLTETLRNLVRRKSTGTVSDYWRLIPQPSDAETADDMQSDALSPKMTPLQQALKVALLDHVVAIGRCLPMYSTPAHQTIRAELTRGLSFATW